jgi:cellulose synthase/poly-beta-1,6-N-acetylglucosamine synthase-like glycosyltransferase/CheY-like chemotaxis protein
LASGGAEGRKISETRVLIAGGQPSFRQALKEALAKVEGVQIVAEVGDGSEAVEQAEHLRPNVVLMAQDLPGMSPDSVMRRIKAKRPKTRVWILADEEEGRVEALGAGADGYFVNGERHKILTEAFKKLHAFRQLPRLMSPDVKPPEFTPRERRLGIALGTTFGLVLLAVIILFPRISLPTIALISGFFFLLYGLKYYASVALILLATSGSPNGNGNGNGLNGVFNGMGVTNGLKNRHDLERPGLFRALVGRILGWDPNGGSNGMGTAQKNGLGNGRSLNNGNGYHFRPSEQPFISIHLPLYNETRVVDRLLEACTRIDYQNYEILVADDSTDETIHHLEKWAKHPKVKVSHRINRTGFKGAALKHALEVMDPRTRFIAVFDADFIPPPTILHQFISYFFGVNGNNGNNHVNGKNGHELELIDESLAVVQGYQWHVLNASENWITRGVRTEFSGSYVVERPGQELTAGMKMISGSVFMIRADLLRDVGWGTSITEDWELTIRLYLEGYRVLYSPFIQAPAECVSDFKQLARQRMRWAEGHTFNVKKYFLSILRSTKLTRREKLEFYYYVPYYLQSVFFLLGTGAWFISEIFLRTHLPFWTATLGWSLVFTNTFALIFMNVAGLFLERGIRRNFAGLLSFVLLTFLLVPYQAYAALKGLLEPHEGGWHRTDKTGVITDVIDRLGLGKRMRRLAPKKKTPKIDLEKRLGKPAAKVWRSLPKPVRNALGRAGRVLKPASGIAFGLVLLAILIAGISRVEAGVGEPQNNFYFHNAPGLSGYVMSQTEPSDVAIGTYDNVSFTSDGWREGQRLASGNSTVYLWIMTEEAVGNQSLHLDLSAGSEDSGWTSLGTTQWNVNTDGMMQFLSISFITEAYDFNDGDQLRLDVIMPGDGRTRINWDGTFNKPRLEIPDNSVPLWSLTVFPAAPLMVYLTSWVWRKRRFALRLASLLIACCVTVGLLATQVQTAGAAPTYDVAASNTFWWYDDTSPLTYMMYQSQPSGTSTSASNTTVSFYSDTWPDTWQINAGTSTVYFYVITNGVRDVNFTLYAGAGASWTQLGTVSWSGSQGSITLVSASFSTSNYTFSTGERLRLDVNPTSKQVTVYWDGSYNNSRLVIPGITVPEGALLFLALVLMIPRLTGALRRRKAPLFRQVHKSLNTGNHSVRNDRCPDLNGRTVPHTDRGS